MADKTVKYDVDGYDAVTKALRELINQYPALGLNETIAFASLGDRSGKAMFPVSGAVVETDTKNILGHKTEVCLYPFYVIYRAAGLSEEKKASVKEWLDTFGKWLEQKEVVIDGTSYRLEEYPPLTEGRKFLSIARQTPAYLDNTSEGKTEDWVVSISARYEYKRNY